jgi:hypothetical protein
MRSTKRQNRAERRKPTAVRRLTAICAWLAVANLIGPMARPAVAAPQQNQTESVRAEKEREALALASQAKGKYAAGAFEAAAGLFMAAYGKVPEPTLLFNAARAYQQAGRPREALPLFQLYLSLNQDADADSQAGRREATQHVAAIEASLRKQGETPTPPPTVKPEPALTPEPVPPPVPPQTEPNVHRPGLFQRVQARPEERGSYRTAALVTGGVGLGLVLTGALVRSLAGGDLNDLDAKLHSDARQIGGVTVHPSVTQREADSVFSSHRQQQVVGNVLIVTGVLGISTGVVLWLLQDESRSAQSAGVWPVLHAGPDGGSLAFAGRF